MTYDDPAVRLSLALRSRIPEAADEIFMSGDGLVSVPDCLAAVVFQELRDLLDDPGHRDIGSSPVVQQRYVRYYPASAQSATIAIEEVKQDISGHRPRGIERPPGSSLGAFAKRVFSRKTYESSIEPTLADMQWEYIEAVEKGDELRLKWILIRGYWSYWCAFAALTPLRVFKSIFDLLGLRSRAE